MIQKPLQHKYRSDIQALRGVAFLGVLAFHAFPRNFPSGYLGVDVFFVISGYVVTPLIIRSLSGSDFRANFTNIRNFYWRRFLRLAPAFASAIIFTIIMYVFLGRFDDSRSVLAQAVFSLLLLGNIGAYLFQGNYFQSEFNPLVHTWSLAVEEQIYIFLPIILLTVFIFSKNRRKTISITYLLLIVVSIALFLKPELISSFYNALGIQIYKQASFYWSPTRFWQFALGGLVSMQASERRLNSRIKKGADKVALLLVATLVATFLSQIESRVGSLLASASTVIILLLGNAASPANRILVWIGDRSYSLYLFHMPLLYIVEFSPIFQSSNTANVWKIVLAIMMTFFASNINFLFVEKRFRNRQYIVSRAYKIKLISVFWILPLALSVFVFAIISDQFREPIDPFSKMQNDKNCKIWVRTFGEIESTRLEQCERKFGAGWLIIGDSHAMNIFNSIASSRGWSYNSKFVVGVATGGCRIWPGEGACLGRAQEFLENNKSKFSRVFYHQSGSYLLQDHLGIYDSNEGFESFGGYFIDQEGIRKVAEKLIKWNKSIPVTWIGPFAEMRKSMTPLNVYFNRNMRINEVSSQANFELSRRIEAEMLGMAGSDLTFIDLTPLQVSTEKRIWWQGCLLYRDKDHWSKCGEKKFSPLVMKYINELLK